MLPKWLGHPKSISPAWGGVSRAPHPAARHPPPKPPAASILHRGGGQRPGVGWDRDAHGRVGFSWYHRWCSRTDRACVRPVALLTAPSVPTAGHTATPSPRPPEEPVQLPKPALDGAGARKGCGGRGEAAGERGPGTHRAPSTAPAAGTPCPGRAFATKGWSG